MILAKLYKNTDNGVISFLQGNVGQHYRVGGMGPVVQGRKRQTERNIMDRDTLVQDSKLEAKLMTLPRSDDQYLTSYIIYGNFSCK